MGQLLPSIVLVVGATLQPPPPSSDYVQYELLQYRDRVEADGRALRTFEGRVLLRTAAAVAELGQVGSPYVDGYGTVDFETVVIEKPDGRRVDVRNGLIEDVNPFGVTGTPLAADVRFKRLTIPGLEPGDRLSYRVVLRQKPLAPGRVFGEIKLAPVIGDPVQTYELDLPRDAGIRVRLREGLGVAWEDVPAAPDRLVRRLSLRVPQPGAQEMRFSKELIQAWAESDVTYTSFSSWSDVGQWWWRLSRGRLDPDATVKAEAAGLVASKSKPREKIEALHRFVASRIRYLSVSFGLGRMQPRPAAEVLANRYGDCKDKHALLAALAATVGIDVRPVLIDSARADLRDEVPSPQQFDHMISVARLGPEATDWLWLDATNPFGVPGYLQPNLRDKRALLVEASGEGRIVHTPVEPPFTPRTEVEVKGTLAPDGTLRARVVWRLRSDEEVRFRLVFATTSEDARAGMIQMSFALEWNDAKVTSASVSEPSDVAEPFRVEFDVERTAWTGRAQGDRGLWIPVPAFGLAEPQKPNPPASPSVELTPREIVARAEIEIPENLSARAPLSVSLERPFASFDSAYSVEGRRLRLTRTLKVSRRSVTGDEVGSYEALRKAIDRDRDQQFAISGVVASAPSATAETLHAEGLDALKRKAYPEAVELLRKATEADPKVKNGFRDLGQALNAAGSKEEAVRAFSRQIEVEPFHENAYAWRAHVLISLDRWEEAEKDLLKQIEVAPFEVWSYERLGRRRMNQGRYREAAEFYGRAVAIKPNEPERWLDLGSAHQKDGRAEEARAALDRARALELPDSLKIRAARSYEAIKDAATAGELATSALPSIIKKLAALSGESFGAKDLHWVERLAEAWYLIGAAAVARGDSAKGEQYLDGAWKLLFFPEAAWGLGNLREKQGRLAEAVELWSMASAVPSATWTLPADRANRIETACRLLDRGLPSPEPDRLPPGFITVFAKPQRQRAAETVLMDLRTIRLRGPVLADLTEEVLLLVGSDGRVERVRASSGKDSEGLKRQLAKLAPIRLAPQPDDGASALKSVRRGLLACSRLTSCAVVLELPGTSSISAVASVEKLGSIEIVRMDPPRGSTLRRGQDVKLVVVVRYDLRAAERGSVILVVQDQAGNPLIHPQPEAIASLGSTELTLTGTFVVPLDATGIDVFLPLTSLGKGPTGTLARFTYAVE